MAYSSVTKPGDHFNTVLWTGNGSDDRNITGVGYQPDWVWIKCRSQAYHHYVFDSLRGATKRIVTNIITITNLSGILLINLISLKNFCQALFFRKSLKNKI